MIRASRDYLLPGEVAKLLFVSPKTISRWADKGYLPYALTPEGHRRFDRVEIYRIRDELTGGKPKQAPKGTESQSSNLPILLLTGPSGVGKDTVLRALIKHHPSRLAGMVSATTRQPRKGECDGRDYFFIKESEFRLMEAAGEFVETTRFNGVRYGTPKSELDRISRDGKQAILCCDTAGVDNLIALGVSFRAVFLDVTTRVQAQRICTRDPQISEAELNGRLLRSSDEKAWLGHRIGHLPIWPVTNNGELEETLRRVEEIFDLA